MKIGCFKNENTLLRCFANINFWGNGIENMPLIARRVDPEAAMACG